MKLISHYLIYVGPERFKLNFYLRSCVYTHVRSNFSAARLASDAAISRLCASSGNPSTALSQAPPAPPSQLGKEDLARQLLELQAEGAKLELQEVELRGALSRTQDRLRDAQRQLENAELDYTVVKGLASFQVQSYQEMAENFSWPPQPLIDDALSDELAIPSLRDIEESAHIEVLEDEEEIDQAQLKNMAQWIPEADLIQKSEEQANRNQETQQSVDQLKQAISFTRQQIKISEARALHLEQRKQELAELATNYGKRIQALTTQAIEPPALLPPPENPKKPSLYSRFVRWFSRKKALT